MMSSAGRLQRCCLKCDLRRKTVICSSSGRETQPRTEAILLLQCPLESAHCLLHHPDHKSVPSSLSSMNAWTGLEEEPLGTL